MPESDPGPPALTTLPRRAALLELALLFFRLGVTAFGGPAAHIAMMEDEVVRRRAWMSREEFLDLYGAANLIPGPNSTEMAIHIGRRRAGWAGLVVAGACFIVPVALITLGFAWAYVRVTAALSGPAPSVQDQLGLARARRRARRAREPLAALIAPRLRLQECFKKR